MALRSGLAVGLGLVTRFGPDLGAAAGGRGPLPSSAICRGGATAIVRQTTCVTLGQSLWQRLRLGSGARWQKGQIRESSPPGPRIRGPRASANQRQTRARGAGGAFVLALGLVGQRGRSMAVMRLA